MPAPRPTPSTRAASRTRTASSTRAASATRARTARLPAPRLPAGRPAAVTQDLDRLGAVLDTAIPRRTKKNLLVATWNVRAFGDLTDKWQAGPTDSPKRDLHALSCIAAVMSRFDVVAVQEVKRDVTALRRMLALLGPSWRVIASDVTEGAEGNAERLAFLYDSRRVQPSGLVGVERGDLAPSRLRRLPARVPPWHPGAPTSRARLP